MDKKAKKIYKPKKTNEEKLKLFLSKLMMLDNNDHNSSMCVK